MDKQSNNDKKNSEKPKDATEQSIQDGKKAVEAAKKLAPGSDEEKEKASKEDAEKWRNEG